jgi:hypothetical protein
MAGLASLLLAEVRVAEGWSVTNILGGILLAALAAGALVVAVLVTLKR